MERDVRDLVDVQLLEKWQRGLPLVRRPFAVLAENLGSTESEIIERLARLHKSGIIARVGGVVRPNTLGASTLAALSAPDFDVEDIAAQIAAEPGINHIYLRENDWNIWFVATGPDRASVDQSLRRVSQRTGLQVLDLRLEKPYHIDLGFTLTGCKATAPELPSAHELEAFNPRPGDRQIAQCMTSGLPLVPRPFEVLAQRLDMREEHVIQRIKELCDLGVFPRIGVIVRHRALGWCSNAMVVWDVPPEDLDRAGARLAASPGVNLCYRRTRYPQAWPYNLYCMIHAKSREDALGHLEQASASADLDRYPRKILFSLRCFKQTGAMVASSKEAA